MRPTPGGSGSKRSPGTRSPGYITLVYCAPTEDGACVGYALVMTPELRTWLHDLRHRDRGSAIQVGQAIGMLLRPDPSWADRLAHSRLSNLEELQEDSR